LIIFFLLKILLDQHLICPLLDEAPFSND